MKLHSRLFLLILGMMIFPDALHADDKDREKAVRQEVWAWDLPQFKEYSVPDKYKNESAVVIARHEQVEATKKGDLKSLLLYGKTSQNLNYTDTERYLVKINDKRALDKFSELSYREEFRTKGVIDYNKVQTIVGARVIKPDGTINEVDVAKEAVTVTEDKKEKEGYKKLAIPNLQIGDILDYFFYSEMNLETENAPSLVLAFYSRYPTLSYSVHCEFENNLTIEYRSINGAPEMKVTTKDDKNTIFDVEKKDLLRIDNINWYSAERDLPMIRMQVLNNSSRLLFKPASARKSGIYNNVPSSTILKDAKCVLATQSTQMNWMNNIDKKVEAALLNYKQKRPDATKEELAIYIYSVLRLYWPDNSGYYPPLKFIVRLEQLLKENGIECKLGFVTDKFSARMSEITESGDLHCIVTANDNKQLFTYQDKTILATDVPSGYQGETASTIVVNKYLKNNPEGIEGASGELKIPETTASQNLDFQKIQVTFSENNPLELVIKRENRSSGSLKKDFQPLLVLYEEWENAMRKHLLIDKTRLQELEEEKSTRKYIEEWQAFYDKSRKEQDDNIKKEINIFHGFDPKEVLGFSIENMGITTENPDFQYTVKYSIEGLVKKAGSNLILDAGKLIGSQWNPSEEERNRLINAIFPAAFSIVNEITVEIPMGYEMQGIENLNYKIENEYGLFASTASRSGNTLRIETRKVYKKSFIPVSDWHYLLEVADETNKFYSQSVILKRIQ